MPPLYTTSITCIYQVAGVKTSLLEHSERELLRVSQNFQAKNMPPIFQNGEQEEQRDLSRK